MIFRAIRDWADGVIFRLFDVKKRDKLTTSGRKVILVLIQYNSIDVAAKLDEHLTRIEAVTRRSEYLDCLDDLFEDDDVMAVVPLNGA